MTLCDFCTAPRVIYLVSMRRVPKLEDFVHSRGLFWKMLPFPETTRGGLGRDSSVPLSDYRAFVDHPSRNLSSRRQSRSVKERVTYYGFYKSAYNRLPCLSCRKKNRPIRAGDALSIEKTFSKILRALGSNRLLLLVSA